MTIVDDFGAELVHDVAWEKLTGQDDYGQPTYQAPQVLKGRTDFTRKNRLNAQGQLFESAGESWLPPVPARVEDRFRIFHTFFPAGEVVQNLDVSPIDDEFGVPYATRLIFG